MKEHIPTIALLSALAMVLVAIIVLQFWAPKTGDNSIAITLASAAVGLAGALGGFSNSGKADKTTATTTTVATTPDGTQTASVKEEPKP